MLQKSLMENKIISLDDLTRLRYTHKILDKTVVFTNGCFDILHAGHVSYLEQAKELGDILILGLNSDQSVKRLKGNNRPIIPERQRALLLAALESIDFVILFEEDTPEHLLQRLLPDILVKGGDYDLSTIVGADLIISNGGKVQALPFVDGFSTTNIIENILNGQG